MAVVGKTPVKQGKVSILIKSLDILFYSSSYFDSGMDLLIYEFHVCRVVWYRNLCTDIKNRSSMIEVHPGNNKNKRSLECDVPPDRYDNFLYLILILSFCS